MACNQPHVFGRKLDTDKTFKKIVIIALNLKNFINVKFWKQNEVCDRTFVVIRTNYEDKN